MEAFIDWMWNDAFAVWWFFVPLTLMLVAAAVSEYRTNSRDRNVVLGGIFIAWLMLMTTLFGWFWVMSTYPMQTFIFLAVGLGAAFVWCGLCLFAAIVTKLLS